MRVLIKEEIPVLKKTTEDFLVKFNHVISPVITLVLESEELVRVNGTVKIAIDKMLSDFTNGLGLKMVFDQLIKKDVSPEGYFLDIKSIAKASISVHDNKLKVSAEYGPSKEWWAKPIALVVLGKLLGDFAAKIEDCGISPGFREEIKKSMQQLRKNNSATLDLRNLFEKQTFYTQNFKVFIKNFRFISVNTSSENGHFVIKFCGDSQAVICN